MQSLKCDQNTSLGLHLKYYSILVFFLHFVIFYFISNFMDLFLYESILISIFLSLSVSFLLLNKRISFNKWVSSALLTSTMFYSISFSTMINIDRSRSLHVISWIHDTGPISHEELEKKIRVKYGQFDRNFIEQRLDEQTKRNILTYRENSYTLTQFGNIIWAISQFLAKVFKLEGWFDAKLLTS